MRAMRHDQSIPAEPEIAAPSGVGQRVRSSLLPHIPATVANLGPDVARWSGREARALRLPSTARVVGLASRLAVLDFRFRMDYSARSDHGWLSVRSIDSRPLAGQSARCSDELRVHEPFLVPDGLPVPSGRSGS